MRLRGLLHDPAEGTQVGIEEGESTVRLVLAEALSASGLRDEARAPMA